MGLVRTKNKVVVGDWNHLRVRRREWKGFVKLNNGPETGTLSKVILIVRLLTSTHRMLPVFAFPSSYFDSLSISESQFKKSHAAYCKTIVKGLTL